MNVKSVALAVMLLTGLGAPAVGTSAEGNSYPSASSESRSGSKVVCRREQVLGTHFKKRVCRTVEQIEKDRQNAREEIQRMQDFRNAQMHQATGEQ
jgi:TolA-binding protein